MSAGPAGDSGSSAAAVGPLAPVVRDGAAILIGFTRALTAAGLVIGPARSATFLAATAALHVDDPTDVYWAGRACLTAGPDDIPVYDAAFAAYFGGRRPRRPPGAPPPVTVLRSVLPESQPPAGGPDQDDDEEPPIRAEASGADILRHRDLALLSAAERAELARMLALLRPGLPWRTSRRRRPARRGAVDPRGTVRRVMAAGGEPQRPARQRRRVRPRRIVLLVDISGSMTAYADSLLRFAHVLARRRPADVEVFTMGTRLTRVTRALASRDPDRALAAAAQAIPDYSGGTRLGEVLRAFVDRWGRRGTARGAVVVVFSDGWERGAPDLLAEQAARLRRLAHTLVWVNPHKGKDGYRPLQGGIVAVLPSVDHFLAGHSLATLQDLVEVMRDA
ncbi:VWA domain-containing protein [Nakamurella flavida]|uniref:VWA domain-containing protein n=1 Tax=Nakamurella flavida TaxID=363630 RepID=A0A938YJ85_9ACTN|nr:VWA domain-containing protein [Nakamurella flavida]MBM9475601.1 VWA domain-containing protein [Nakamurella flavida]MDP9778123.1 uncharacterized protein with von Willebrand factor type A (vWA) domain [Nakamurella flavida]